MRNLNKILITFLLILTTAATFAQQSFKVTYQQLKEYEGLYEYYNGSELKISASPKDTVLVAIINLSTYPLKAVSKDVFLNNANVPIRFLRDASNNITGFTEGNKQPVKLINKNVSVPEKMWYPKLGADVKTYQYKYAIPADLKDGLQTGDASIVGLDTTLLDKMMIKIVRGQYPNVHSILIIKGGKLVFEEYFYEYTKDSLQEMRSATKSFISALTGIAINKGFIKSKDEKVVSYFPEYNFANNTDIKKTITIENMLTNQSGLDCDAADPKAIGTETAMDESEDWIKYTLDLPMIDKPDAGGRYCSGNPITVGRIVEIATHMPLPDFGEKNLFGPLDIKGYKWSFKPDKSSVNNYCQIYLKPRDMAKFGLLYLNKGVWNNKQVMPAEWVEDSFKTHSVVQGVDYGYLWWLRYLDADGVRYYAKTAQGNGGQKIYVFPDQDLVIAITGGNYNSQSPSNELVSKYILPAFNKK
ncbi:MAG: putative periplasmic esterase [Mucilaginibacter sp.]|nr:putative periplasmic esterase [Mucilaginibacter sp.]